MEPVGGIEPPTRSLRMSCSTSELHRPSILNAASLDSPGASVKHWRRFKIQDFRFKPGNLNLKSITPS